MRSGGVARIDLASLVGAGVLAALCGGCSVSHSMRQMSPPGAAATAEPTAACEARGSDEGTIRWFGPERAGDRRALDRWCSAVGPAVVLAEPPRTLPPLSPDDTLTVVTWNASVGSGDLLAFLEQELDYACLTPPTADFGGHFVLLLQEAFRASADVPVAPEGAPVPGRIEGHPPSGERIDIEAAARQCGLALFYVPSMRNGTDPGPEGREDRGSAILSTLPLSDLAAVELPLEAQRRVVPLATVPAPGSHSLRVASVHLDVAGNLLRVLGTGGSMRVRQAAGLVEVLDALDPSRKAPIVVAGDMNTWSERETVILRLLELFPDSPPPGEEGTRSGWPADHLFYRGEAAGLKLLEGSYVVLPDAHGSDHKARAAKFLR